MNYEEIKEQLESEIESLLSLNTNQTRDALGSDKFEAMREHISNTNTFYKMITDKLNEILEENNITLDEEDEKEKFLVFIRPTILEAIQKFILN